MDGVSATRTSDQVAERGKSRQSILRAAADLIARSGVRGLRVEEVARAAGVSTSLLYYHFGNRDGLVRAAVDYAQEQAPSTQLVLASNPGSGYDAVAAGLLAELDETPAVRVNNVVWNEASALAVFDPALGEEMQRVTAAWERTIAEGIERGIADGSINADVDSGQAAQLLTSLIDGVSQRWLAGSMPLARAREIVAASIERELRSALLN